MSNSLLSPAQIKAARALINWKQQDLANKLGLTSASIANMESGKTTTSIDQMHAIINIFAKQNICFIEGGVKKVSQQVNTFTIIDGLKLLLDSVYEHCSSTQDHQVYLINYNEEQIHKKLGDYKMFHVKRMLKLKKPNILNLIPSPSTFACSFVEYRLHQFGLPENIILAIIDNQIFTIDYIGNTCFYIKSSHLAEFWQGLYSHLWENGTNVTRPSVYFHDVG